MDRDRVNQQFEASRPRLRALAHRMLGSYEEAEDAVQEAWLRVDRAGATGVDNIGGWLTTVVARICLDRLRARRSRPEDTSGRLPERRDGAEPAGPEDEVLLAESVGAALLVVLDRLAPAERVAFVLHDVFAVPFDEVGAVLDRTPEAARQLASRARRRVQGTAPAADLDIGRRREVVDAFLGAARGGDLDGLLAVLHPDVVLRPDAEAVRLGSFAETHGAGAVAALLRGGASAARPALVGGLPGLAWAPGGRVRGAIAFDIVDGCIVEIHVVGDGDELVRLDVVVLDA
ncbi:MAG TPA: sigma-70 family RNA polymerase sigma factor [Acidimicrobiales bacterium]|nr:sigma-70 family RNA polymerase sigma factor [Acidimicrobiales bacterium]